jgi:hypothetical protein
VKAEAMSSPQRVALDIDSTEIPVRPRNGNRPLFMVLQDFPRSVGKNVGRYRGACCILLEAGRSKMEILV